MTPPMLRVAGVVLGSLTLLLAAAYAPTVLRSLDSFDVERVEVTGTLHLTGEAAVEASGITAAANVFDDFSPWLRSLRRHPLVADVRIERRVPSTLIIHVTEAVPVAFARTPELRAIDRTGRALPADLAHAAMDLPILSVQSTLAADGRVTDEETRRVVDFIALVDALDPTLLGWVSEVGVHGEAIRLVLRNAADTEVLITPRPTADRLVELHATLEELATPQLVGTDSADGDVVVRTEEPELSRVRRIDVRFADQIVVAGNRRTR